jgi:MtN3 and saliva related transmembrane protein
MVLKFTIATIVPITSSIQLLPQLYKSYQTKSVDDLSPYSLLLILFNNILWLFHGYFIFDYSLIISASLSLCINTILFIFYILYHKK